jgi:hypothetical protein
MYKVISGILIVCFIFCGSYAVYDLFIKDLLPKIEETPIVSELESDNANASEYITNMGSNENPKESSTDEASISQGDIQSNSAELENSESNHLIDQIDAFLNEFKIIDDQSLEIDNIESDQEYWQKLYLTNPSYRQMSHAELIPRLKYSGYNRILSNLKRLEDKIDVFENETSSSLSSVQLDKIKNLKATINRRKGLLSDKIFFAKSAMEF